MSQFESLIKKLIDWNNQVHMEFQVDYKLNKREYTFRLKNIYLKMVVPGKVSALIHTHTHAQRHIIYKSNKAVYKYISSFDIF